uniref:Uncharacterized protein n=1 Tax=Arundo donax TaxID=35708 RepID=A0A0A9FRE0_ARUDO
MNSPWLHTAAARSNGAAPPSGSSSSRSTRGRGSARGRAAAASPLMAVFSGAPAPGGSAK